MKTSFAALLLAAASAQALVVPDRAADDKTKTMTSTVCTTSSEKTWTTTKTISSCTSSSTKPSLTTSCTVVTMSTPPPPPQPTCPGVLSGNWEFPHLIVHVNSANPDKAYGNFLNGTADGSISSIFNFDIPASDAGKMCTMEFMFPTQSMLETSAYTFNSTGVARMSFAMLQAPATADTTYGSSASVSKYLGSWGIMPGNAYKSAPFACPAGQQIGIWMWASGSMSLNYFQDFNPCPIGAYITVA